MVRSLAYTHRKLSREWHPSMNGELTPRDVTAGSGKKVWWVCDKGPDHIWQTQISHRAKHGSGCPFCSGRRASATSSLLALHPEIAAQWHASKNEPLAPCDVSPGSGKSVWWQCDVAPDHQWKARIAHRALNGVGCPFCANKRASSTNSLAALFPEVALELHPTRNPGLRPEQVVAGSERKVWWRCLEGPDHEWQASVASRTRVGTGCPFCAGLKTSVTNSLAGLFPEVAAQWHPERNGASTPADVVAGSNKYAWWKCPAGPDHEWRTMIAHRTRNGSGCPFCAGKKASVDNSLASRHPELAVQWHPKRNGTLTPADVTTGSGVSAWWKCPEGPDHEWWSRVIDRVRRPPCPFCSGQLLSSTNSVAARFPEIALEWDPERNGELTPRDVLAHSSQRVWWRCACGLRWQATVRDRTVYNISCPRCERAEQAAARPDVAEAEGASEPAELPVRYERDSKRLTVRLICEGLTHSQITDRLSLPSGRVMEWSKVYVADGLVGLLELPVPAPDRGNQLLSQPQKKYLGWLLDQGARAHGHETDAWDHDRVRALARDVLDVEYGIQGIGCVLRNLGFQWRGTPQASSQRRPERIRELSRLAVMMDEHRRMGKLRQRAVRMKKSGCGEEEICTKFRVTLRTLEAWWRYYRAAGHKALGQFDPAAIRGSSWRPLSARQKERLYALLETGAQACGFKGEWWSDYRLVSLIEQKFGVRYARGSRAWIVELFAGRVDLLEKIGRTGGDGWWRRPPRELDKPELCPDCRRAFLSGLRPHLCEQVPLSEHFSDRPPKLAEYFYLILRHLRALGDFTVRSLPDRIVLLSARAFAQFEVNGRKLLIKLHLDKPHPEFGRHLLEDTTEGVLHRFALTRSDDLDNGVRSALTAAYRFGLPTSEVKSVHVDSKTGRWGKDRQFYELVSTFGFLPSRVNRATLEDAIVRLCSIRPLSAAELSEILNRTKDYLQTDFLKWLVQEGELVAVRRSRESRYPRYRALGQ